MSASQTIAREAAADRSWYLEDWVNPVLLKEVRQALRGKYFKVCFWLTLLAVTIVSAGVLVNNGADGTIDAREGVDFVFWAQLCLSIAVLGLVPFSAFTAMGAEWDENTFDLLVISNVRPRGIVLGKLLAAGVQTMLFYSAFTPYLVLASLMQGVDLTAVAVVLIGTLLLSMILSTLSLALSTLSRVRFARVVLMAALSALLVLVTSVSLTFTRVILADPGVLQDSEAAYAMVSAAVFPLVIAAYSFGIACVMLSHAEENRSTGMRVLTTACLLGVLAWMKFMSAIAPSDVLTTFGITTVTVLLLPSIFFVSEAEKLPRRVVPRLPAQPGLGQLVSPYLPGGARGFLLLLFHLGLILAGMIWILRGSSGSMFGMGSGPRSGGGGVLPLFAMICYAIVYLGLPSAILSPFTAQPSLRTASRALIPFVIGAFAFVPAVLGFFLGDRSLMNMQHPGNPMYLILETWEHGWGNARGTWVLLIVLTMITLLANLPRVGRAAREVFVGSMARAQREQARSASRARASDAVA
jgi:hypothetical protein